MPRNSNGHKSVVPTVTASPSNGLKGFVKSQAKAQSASGSTLRGSWADIDATTVCNLLLAVTHVGGAIMFGTDKQGFGLTVSLYVEKEKVSKWFHPEQGQGGAFYEWADSVIEACYNTSEGLEGH